MLNMYYTEPNVFIRIHIIYINANNNIEKLIEETVILEDPGLLNKDELTNIISQYSHPNYSLYSILKINVNIQPDNLIQFLHNQTNDDNLFIQEISNIHELESIHFEKSISMFHDINNLLILFQNNLNK